ncbi:MAG: tRNA lysidine(34) synthetase TilS, partial [Gammaproteobacteria bacterium]|nr:tRNA lysidine(34) synthetase TilS [Gammaproteobacteria bacterium]
VRSVQRSVTFNAGALQQSLAALEAVAGRPERYVIAFSGGLDSTVLLHALHATSEQHGVPLLAIHVDHGLHDDSGDWARHCESVATGLGVCHRCLSVAVQLESGQGPEASAREARYTALHGELRGGDWLLSAHHREDQAETLLINLVRGSGPAGIAGIGKLRPFGPGWLVRPLLDVERVELETYAAADGLQWVEDPSNQDRRFDRNFLRHEILPRLKARWPDIAARLQRSAQHASEASQLLANLAEIDLESLGGAPERLPIDALTALSSARQRNLLRHALRSLGLSTPTALQLRRILEEVIPAREDAQPLVSWPGAAVRRYRNALYLLPEKLEPAPESVPVSGSRVAVGAGLGELVFEKSAGRGLAERVFAQGLRLAFRHGGEEFQPYGHRHTRKLKKLLQEEGVVPWMRDRLPLLYAGERLVAVGDLWLAADVVAEPGVAVHWERRPVLH